MRVIIIGANGQLGKSLITTAPKNIDLIPLSRQELDLCNLKACEEEIIKINPDWVINAAAYTEVDKAESNIDLALKINRDSIKKICLGIKKTGGRLLHISTDYVFNGSKKSPYHTNDKKEPISIYGYSKSCGEEVIKTILGDSKNASIIRTSWLMGPTGNNFIKTMLDMHQNKKLIKVVSDQKGCPTSTFSLSNICWKIIEKYKNKTLNPELPLILHWCDRGPTSWNKIAELIGDYALNISLIKRKAKVVPISSSEYRSKAKRPKYSQLDCSDTKKILNIEQLEWEATIKEVLDFIHKEKNP